MTDFILIETAVDNLTAQTTSLLAASAELNSGVTAQIADAVALSENAALPVMYSMTGNQIDLTAAVFQLINGVTQ